MNAQQSSGRLRLRDWLSNQRRLLVAVFTMVIWLVGGISTVAQNLLNEATDPPKEIVRLEGKVVDLSVELRENFDAQVPLDAPSILGFRSKDDKLYTLAFTRSSSALFLDKRVRGKASILVGRLFANSRIFEATGFRYVKNGIVHDIHYWCDVCAIRSITGGECVCCRDELELVEKAMVDVKSEDLHGRKVEK